MNKRILVVNGPNINLTGLREPTVYGSETLEDINRLVNAQAEEMGLSCTFFQSNSEGDIIDAIHRCLTDFDARVRGADCRLRQNRVPDGALCAFPAAEPPRNAVNATSAFLPGG